MDKLKSEPKPKPKSQKGGTSTKLLLKPFIKSNHHYISNFISKLRGGNLNKITNTEHISYFKLLKLFTQKAGSLLKYQNIYEITKHFQDKDYMAVNQGDYVIYISVIKTNYFNQK